MDKKDYIMITLGVTLLVSLGLNVMPEPTHTCESRELQAYCFDVSLSTKTCYTLPEKTGGKRCTEGWRDIEQITEAKQTQIIEAKQWLCSSGGCIPK